MRHPEEGRGVVRVHGDKSRSSQDVVGPHLTRSGWSMRNAAAFTDRATLSFTEATTYLCVQTGEAPPSSWTYLPVQISRVP